MQQDTNRFFERFATDSLAIGGLLPHPAKASEAFLRWSPARDAAASVCSSSTAGLGAPLWLHARLPDLETVYVATPGQRFGANAHLRVYNEMVAKLILKGKNGEDLQ